MDRPPYDTAAPGDTLGLKHVREALADVPFPQTTSELREHVGNWRIPTTGIEMEPFSEYLDGVPERTFHSPEEVADAVARAHPELREHPSLIRGRS